MDELTPLPTPDEPTNWGRWGRDDRRGAVNLIDDKKRLQAFGLIRTGEVISLSRDFSTGPHPDDPYFAHQFVQVNDGIAVDYVNMPMHMVTNTHVDALNHSWDVHGMWNGRDPKVAFQENKMMWGDVSAWGDGIVTRGVLFDVPRYRGTDCVTLDDPVRGEELEGIAREKGLVLDPGDALLVYSGRENWEARHGGAYSIMDRTSMASESSARFFTRLKRPGLGISCLEFIRRSDCAMVMWDMMDAYPNDLEEARRLGYEVVNEGYSPFWRVTWAYGMALIDESRLDKLAQACRREDRWEFAVMVAPLRISFGTGSPVNPLAIL